MTTDYTMNGSQFLEYSEYCDLRYANGIRMSGDPEGKAYFMERCNLTESMSDDKLIALRHEHSNGPPVNISYLYGAEWVVYRGQTFGFNVQLWLCW